MPDLTGLRHRVLPAQTLGLRACRSMGNAREQLQFQARVMLLAAISLVRAVTLAAPVPSLTVERKTP